MLVSADSTGTALQRFYWVSHLTCPCKEGNGATRRNSGFSLGTKRACFGLLRYKNHRRGARCKVVCMYISRNGSSDFSLKFDDSAKGAIQAQKLYIIKHHPNELDYEELDGEHTKMASHFTNFHEDPMVGRLHTQLGAIHPVATPPINRNIGILFVFFFFFGVVFDKLWTSRKKKQAAAEAQAGIWPQVPTSFSLFLEKDLQRKESVEWVNMVVGKLWKVYREGLENWLVGLLQPVIDDLKKPDYVQRVEIKQFSLGEEPLSVRNVERRTSRRADDLQYQIGLRYTGDARMLLALKLKFGIIPVVVPVGIRGFDIDGELWVKLRLIPSEPWVGAASWAFVALPKIKFILSPFRLFNIMGIPVLSTFLVKLLTEDLPCLFVRPKKSVLDFQKGRALGPVSEDFNTETFLEGNENFVGELSVTLVDARKLSYLFFAKTDPYVILSLGDQVVRSKKNSQTTVIGPPGEPIWNQDFHMLVKNPRKQKLTIQVRDSIGFTDFTIGTGEIDLGSLQDTVPKDRIVALQGGWTPFGRGSSGEILIRLTYKAYVEDEEDDATKMGFMDSDISDDDLLDIDEINVSYVKNGSDDTVKKEESFMGILTDLLLSEEFQGIVASETRTAKVSKEPTNSQPLIFRPRIPNADFSLLDSESLSEVPGESAILWLAALSSIAIWISISIDCPVKGPGLLGYMLPRQLDLHFLVTGHTYQFKAYKDGGGLCNKPTVPFSSTTYDVIMLIPALSLWTWMASVFWTMLTSS